MAFPPWLPAGPPEPQVVRLPSVPGVGSHLRGLVDRPAKGSRQPCPPTTKNGGDRLAGPLFPRRQVCPNGALFVHLTALAHIWLFCSFLGRWCCVSGRGAGCGMWGLEGFGRGCCAGMRPFILTSSCGNGFLGALWLCHLQWLPLPSGLVPSAFPQALRVWALLWLPSLSFSTSNGKHGPCSCQPQKARFPPTSNVMEGNLGAAPLRSLPGISPSRVETCGGILWWSSVGGISCCLCFGARFGFLPAC